MKGRLKKIAFTLAEVLITLGIIGVVAAITIPSMLSHFNKVITINRLKDTYAQFSSVAKQIEGEYGAGWDMSDASAGMSGTWSPQKSEAVFNKYFRPYLKINFKYSDTDCSNLTKAYTLQRNGMFVDYNGACYNLANGSSIAFWAGKLNEDSTTEITINVIPYPNKSAKIMGKDVFSFSLQNDGNGIFITTVPKRRYPDLTRTQLINYCKSENSSGRVSKNGYQGSVAGFCTELLLQDKFEVKPDYPVKF